MEHVLLTAPPGSGKSTMAALIAEELGDPIKSLTVTGIERKHLIRELKIPNFRGGVLFLDEIHGLSKKDQEIFLPVLGRNMVMDERGRELLLPWLTVIGATTERDKLITPLVDRFPIVPEFEPYSDEEMADIVGGMAVKAEVHIGREMALGLGGAAGGVPRAAERLVLAVRALRATVEDVTIDMVLDLCSVDADGLTALHLKYLNLLESQDGKAGQKTIESILRIPAGYVRELERLLVERELITYTAAGRVLTSRGEGRIRTKQPVESYTRQ